MGIFGRGAHRRRVRRAARRSLPPPFPVPAECTGWLFADLWPAELSKPAAETAPPAAHLHADLRRIAESTNARLGQLNRADRAGAVRVIECARRLAAHRVESTTRQLHDRRPAPGPHRRDGAGLHGAGPGFGHDRLRRLLGIVARQQPELRWAAGDRADGTTVLVTDLAHGWVPSGIAVPAGVRLLAPQRRDARLVELLGPTTESVTYAPADRFAWPPGSAVAAPSSQPRQLPMIDDLQTLVADAAHRCDDLPALVHTVAVAVAEQTEIIDAELDLLQVRLDTARYRLVARYPDTDEPLLLTCLLLAATVDLATGDAVSANYHFAWFVALTAPGPTGPDR